MAKYYKLIDTIGSSATFNLPHKQGENLVYQFYTLYPGTKYAEYADDEAFLTALRQAHKRFPYTADLERSLHDSGAKYEVITCKVCGGRAKKIDVWLVEVVE